MKADWLDPKEKGAYVRLKGVLVVVEGLGLTDSKAALELLLRRRVSNGRWDWLLYQDFVIGWELELQEKDVIAYRALTLIKEILGRTLEAVKAKGELIDLHKKKWTEIDNKRLENSLGVVVEILNKRSGDSQIAILLIGMGFILLFENKGRLIDRRIGLWLEPSEQDDSIRFRAVEDFLTIREKGIDERSDSRHIRNAFAHGHLEFMDKSSVVLWDIDPRTKGEIFRKKYSLLELGEVFNTLGKKIGVAEAYSSILIITQGLFELFEDEWKLVRG